MTQILFAQKVQVTAHRGASGYAPENTVVAVERALRIGVDRIEVDVQQTIDGVVICLHDLTLNRTTDAKGKVGRRSWNQLSEVKAFAQFEEEFPDEPIPTLESVFKRMDGKTQLVVEIKSGNRVYPGIEDNVVALIRKYKAENWTVIHSFNDRVLHYIHEKYPDIRLQKLFVSYSGAVMLDFKLHSAKLTDYDFTEGFGISRSGVTQKLVDQIHEMGKVVHVWTVNDKDEILKMLGLGVDGVISNYPDRVKELIRKIEVDQ